MLKAVCTLTLLVLPITTLISPVSLAQNAPNASTEVAIGVCGLYNRAGYLVVDESGNLVSMGDYCQRQHDRSAPAISRFWEAFTATASSKAIEVANSLGQEEVVTYGTTICPFLEQGGSLSELRQIQDDGDLPRDFEVAVTIAAIHTYCPVYSSQLGR